MLPGTHQNFSLEDRPQKYCKEVVICRRMRHCNVLSVEGVAPQLFELCMVSKWMSQGNMTQYMKNNENVDRMKLVSLLALCGASVYVHPRCSVGWHHAGPRLSPLERFNSRRPERRKRRIQLPSVMAPNDIELLYSPTS